MAGLSEATANLLEAAQVGDVTVVKDALKRGAKVDKRSECGLAALHFAAMHGHADVAAELVMAGANTSLQTKDAARATPATLALGMKHYAVLHVLAKKELLKNPLRRRFLGPVKVCLAIILNTAMAFALTDPDLHWNGWTPPTGECLGGATLHRRLYLPLCVLCLLLLLIVNVKDPGYLHREEAAPAEELWKREQGSRNFVFVDEDMFGYVWPNGRSDVFTWCYSCKLWRPQNAAHCTICRRCCHRFDHHCDVVGTCIGAGNHLAFVALLLAGSISWMFAVLSVSAHFYYHGAVDALKDINQAGIGDWPLYASLVFVCAGAVCSSMLFCFACFHASTLFFNFNTKKVMKGKDRGTWCRPNTCEVMGSIFCAPCTFRTCGAPEALPLQLVQTDASNFRGHEFCMPSKAEERPWLEQSSTFSGSDSDSDSMV